MRSVFSVLILCFMLVSCQDESIMKRSAKIDSLLVIVDSLNQEVLTIDIDSVNTILSGSGKLMDELSVSDKFGTDKKIMANVTLLVGINRFCGKFIDKYSNFQKELAMSEHQLFTLQQDLEQKSLSDSLFLKYFDEEKAILEKLSQDIDHNLNWLQKDISLYQNVYKELLVIKEGINDSDKND